MTCRSVNNSSVQLAQARASNHRQDRLQDSKTSASGAYDATTYSYAYAPGGITKIVTDAGRNIWNWTYDLLGRQVSVADPDTGTTTDFGHPIAEAGGCR